MLDGDVVFVFLLAVCCAQATVTPAFITVAFAPSSIHYNRVVTIGR